MRNMAFAVDGRTFVLVHNDQEPSDAEWNAYIAEFGQHQHQLHEVRTLVFTQGGAPTLKQRQKLQEILSGSATRTAVISAAAEARITASVLRSRNPQMRTFLPEEFPQALDHLGVPSAEQERLRRLLSSLQRQVGIAPSASETETP